MTYKKRSNARLSTVPLDLRPLTKDSQKVWIGACRHCKGSIYLNPYNERSCLQCGRLDSFKEV